MNCLKCGNEFKPKHKYNQFCSRLCRVRNYFGKDRKETDKLYAPNRVTVKKEAKVNLEYFDWKDYPNGV